MDRIDGGKEKRITKRQSARKLNRVSGSPDGPGIIYLVTVEGVVQGVGFRPFIARLAMKHGLRGWVRNTGGSVEILICGSREETAGFLREARIGPPQSDIRDFTITELRAGRDPGEAGFHIIGSLDFSSGLSMPPADLSVCEDCLCEMNDSGNRRFRHPFISCTDCGPRYSIMESLPYDRHATSMADFPMCPACSSEYLDPEDRRFHAQTISCHDCGPQLALFEAGGCEPASLEKADDGKNHIIGSDAILTKTVRLIRTGRIVALKGIGGYQLLCDPFSDDAVKRLRAVKQRDAKPFAVMFPSMDSIRSACRVSMAESTLLESPAHPIVLLEPLLEPLPEPLRHSTGKPFSAMVGSGSRHIGAFLPYTPLHQLILQETGPLVATSANLSGHPVISDDHLMKEWLEMGLDAMLTNNRRIVAPQDDSVAWTVRGQPQLIRRARGYAPLSISPVLQPILPTILPSMHAPILPSVLAPILAPVLPPVPQPVLPPVLQVNKRAGETDALPAAGRTVLALGGQSKAGWCLLKDGYAHMGEYLGDLEDEAAWLAWNQSIAHALVLLGGRPDLIACDAHPRYRTWAFPLLADFPDDRIVAVQHHHAHIASVMAEHNLEGPVLGVSFDGTGYGSDGSVWGGEFLVCTGGRFTRAAALKPIPMLGGDASVEEGWKSLLCHLHAAGLGMPPGKTDAGRDALVAAALRRGVNTIASSSIGRLFDAVSALLGFSQTSRYEGECAILLEAAAVRTVKQDFVRQDADILQYAEKTVGPGACIPGCPDSISHDGGIPLLAFGFEMTRDGMPVLDPAPVFSGLLAGLRQDIPPGLLSLAFHYAVACATMKMLKRLSPTHQTKDAALSGGVFQNRLLLDLLLPLLEAEGFRVYLHRRVPPNDGGLALGQAFVACRKG